MSEHGGPIRTTIGINVETIALEDPPLDTLIIGGNTQVVPTSAALSHFLTGAVSKCRRISSICTGAFALGDAGVLTGRRVTTHWLFTAELKLRFPDIRLEEDKLYVVDGPVWTAAGNSAGIDLALAMLESDYGAEIAYSVAKIMVVDYRRAGAQSQHSAMLGLNPKTDRIQDALNHARANIHAPLCVQTLARVANLGVRQFSRTFHAETGNSPAQAIESLRLEAARLMLAQTRHPIEAIAIKTGFGDAERMRRSFVRAFGSSPQAMRRQPE